MSGSTIQTLSIIFGSLIVLGNHLATAKENEDDYLFCNGQVCLPKNYSTEILPIKPVIAGVHVYSIEVKRVMDEDMSLMIELGIRYAWLANTFEPFFDQQISHIYYTLSPK